jgi:hypothetical protein
VTPSRRNGAVNAAPARVAAGVAVLGIGYAAFSVQPGAASVATAAKYPALAVTTTSSTPSHSAKQLISAAVAATAAQPGVRWQYRLADGNLVFEETGSAGQTSGWATDTSHQGNKVAWLEAVLLGQLYINGNTAGLEEFGGLYSAPAKREAGKWLVTGKGSVLLHVVGSDLTMAGLARLIDIGGTDTMGGLSAISGRTVIGVYEKVRNRVYTAQQEVYLPQQGEPLPVRLDVFSQGTTSVEDFGPWGTPPKVVAPRQVVPIPSTWVGIQ